MEVTGCDRGLSSRASPISPDSFGFRNQDAIPTRTRLHGAMAWASSPDVEGGMARSAI